MTGNKAPEGSKKGGGGMSNDAAHIKIPTTGTGVAKLKDASHLKVPSDATSKPKKP